MEKKYFKYLLNLLLILFQKDKLAGFTLIELLIATVIGCIAISGLLSVTVQLLQTDQKESVRSETQSDMQMALDYINKDIREAVYVYDGNCLQGQPNDPNNYCPGIVNRIQIPVNSNSVPVLAFWKLEPLPNECQNTLNQLNDPCQPFRLAGRTYSLVVYFLTKKQSVDIWQGQARVTRYELNQFTGTGNNFQLTSGYVSPTASGTSFRTWPDSKQTGTWQSLANSMPTVNADTLVDFVDASGGSSDDPCTSYNSDPNNPDYITSPSSTTLGSGFAGIRSFYACVRVASTATQQTQQQSGLNQDVIVFIKGNPKGRQGYDSSSFLPTLKTQVLGRGVVDKQPQQQ